jgi:tetratricopeptide (TPR) repeat protein
LINSVARRYIKVPIVGSMDPFSTATAAVGVISLCEKVISQCRIVLRGGKSIEAELNALIDELENLRSLMTSIHESCTASEFKLSSRGEKRAERVHELMRPAIKHYEELVKRLHIIVFKISGADHDTHPPTEQISESRIDVQASGRFDRIVKAWRKEEQRGEMADVRLRIVQHQNIIQVQLTALGLIYSQDTLSNISRVAEDVQTCLNLHNQVTAVLSNPFTRDFYAENPVPEDILNSVKTNIHFYIPSSVVTFFKGRQGLLEELKTEFTKPTGTVQKRFVIYGLPGSGKTQFCCKFAQDLRALFWGIFFIDASSRAYAESSLCDIAVLAGGNVAPTKEAAKHFLANVGMPWLLIIDNADDEELDVEDYFPHGERGCILITTRDRDRRHLGTIGSKFYSFERLADTEAEELLLETAEEHQPYKEEATRAAKLISKELHCLPLALVLAGKAIRTQAASWTGYMDYYQRNRQNLARRAIESKQSVGMHDRERRTCVYVNFEPLIAEMEYSIHQAARDAFELMQFFAFLHHRNIRRDILIKAVKNPRIEANASEAEEEDQAMSPFSRSIEDWWNIPKQQLKRFFEAILSNPRYSWLFVRPATVIPAILRNDALLDNEVDLDRLNRALFHLQKYSFISPGEEMDTYTVHPLIHEWMRIRLDSSAREAIWCEAAASALAQCIVLGASALGPERVFMRNSQHFVSRELQPHIRHVRQCQQHLYERIQKAQLENRRRFFAYPVSDQSSLTASEAVRLARFSIIHFQCGDWHIARELQEQVRAFVVRMWGNDHPAFHRITAALAATYYLLDMFGNSVRMMRDIVASSIRMYGDDHPRTLKSIGFLAQLLCYNGRITESLQLHKKAWETFRSLESHGPGHKDTLIALRQLGAVQARFFRYDESAQLCEQALEGLSRCNDVENEILFTKADIAVAISQAKRNFDRARALMEEVLERRKAIWGDEHPYTVFAELNFGRVEHDAGDYHAAEARLRRILLIGIRSVDKTHSSVVLAERFLAQSLVGLKRFVEAEELYKKILLDHVEGGRQKCSFSHVQRILALWFLAECYDESGRFADAKEVAEELLDSLAKIGEADYGLKHPLHTQVVNKLEEIKGKIDQEMMDKGCKYKEGSRVEKH